MPPQDYSDLDNSLDNNPVTINNPDNYQNIYPDDEVINNDNYEDLRINQ